MAQRRTLVRSDPETAAAHLRLPSGRDERVAGFGVMGLPFASGHYLAFRDFPVSSFAPSYRSVWHRDPDGVWTFYATTPGPQSCSRYFSSATPIAPVQCDIRSSWVTPWSLHISIAGQLDWWVDIQSTTATRLATAIGSALPASAWRSTATQAAMSRAVGPLLGTGRVQLAGTLPNGQWYRIAPKKVWTVRNSRATWNGRELGAPRSLTEQACLGDFRLPQRGICVVGHGCFETFDVGRHRCDGLELSR
ncbi:hypothetical protein BTO20_12680 [Mycobacterium dioxanotrophicus]|uniref:Uncharacterized protein n=1 Tax=Mycobacterium dioxanotrophicus TaxID=482462 RepID=A0A1Y0C2B2_9MYCO|nr:hypothetical protein [Mycobacterium dioxanotrophicus]ART69329.1 hypothetical protein BTO20_12680 [Mycobacterium dioxanotrophicus]